MPTAAKDTRRRLRFGMTSTFALATVVVIGAASPPKDSRPNSWRIDLSVSARDGSHLMGEYRFRLDHTGKAKVTGRMPAVRPGEQEQVLFEDDLSDQATDDICDAAMSAIDAFDMNGPAGYDGVTVQLSIGKNLGQRSKTVAAGGLRQTMDAGDDVARLMSIIDKALPERARVPRWTNGQADRRP